MGTHDRWSFYENSTAEEAAWPGMILIDKPSLNLKFQPVKRKTGFVIWHFSRLCKAPREGWTCMHACLRKGRMSTSNSFRVCTFWNKARSTSLPDGVSKGHTTTSSPQNSAFLYILYRGSFTIIDQVEDGDRQWGQLRFNMHVFHFALSFKL